MSITLKFLFCHQGLGSFLRSVGDDLKLSRGFYRSLHIHEKLKLTNVLCLQRKYYKTRQNSLLYVVVHFFRLDRAQNTSSCCLLLTEEPTNRKAVVT